MLILVDCDIHIFDHIGDVLLNCKTVTNYSKPLQLGCSADRDTTGYCTLVKLSTALSEDYQVISLPHDVH